MNTFTRRNFFFASSGAAAGSLLVPGLLEAAEGEKLDFTNSGLATGNLKPLKLKEIPGFLSAEQIAPHHTAHYGGALKTLVSIDGKFEESFQKGTAIDPQAFETMQRQKSSRGQQRDPARDVLRRLGLEGERSCRGRSTGHRKAVRLPGQVERRLHRQCQGRSRLGHARPSFGERQALQRGERRTR